MTLAVSVVEINRTTKVHHMLSIYYGEATIREKRIVSYINARRTMIVTTKTFITVEEKMFSKV